MGSLCEFKLVAGRRGGAIKCTMRGGELLALKRVPRRA